jgi:PHD/YefM family antitoxin component YafN of YafNO toxin-antitoxin module
MAAQPQEQYVVDPKGRKTAVILSLKRCRELMEDLHDLAVIAERCKERSVSLEEVRRRLKEDGLL